MNPPQSLRAIRSLAFVGLGLLATAPPTRAAEPGSTAIPKPIELWPAGAPGATGDSDEDKPAIYPFLPAADKGTGAAVLICPGGGFMTRCMDHEGVLIAQWFQARGVAGFVLRYRIRPLYPMAESVRDANRAMQFLRANANQFKISPDRIGIIGFSAGAELAAAATFRPPIDTAEADDNIVRQPTRANFMVLVYGAAPLPRPESGTPAATGSAVAPPTYMFCTAEDVGHLNGMVELYAALRRARVPVEAHFFANGEHGVSFAHGDPVLGTWPDQMFNWIRAGGFLTPQKRVAIKGVIRVDGEPLPHGSVVFIPVDSSAPPAAAYVLNTGPVRGQYAVRADQGLTPGKYRVEVRQDAVRWMSNSRDPLIQRMLGKQRSGSLTDDDRKEWNEHIRKRDLSPAIEGVRVYRTLRPDDGKGIAVEVKPDAENTFDIDVATK